MTEGPGNEVGRADQLNDRAVFLPNKEKIFEYHVNITPEPLIGSTQTKAIHLKIAKTFGSNFKPQLQTEECATKRVFCVIIW